MRAMVLAAGVGSRLDPLTSQVPKPLVPVANRPVLEHILKLLKKHGFDSVISNLHYLPEQIKEYFGDGSSLGMKLSFLQERELSGDAGGVRACKSFFGDETFIVLMGDLLTDADLTRIISEHKSKRALATIAIKEVEDVSQFGVVVTNKDGFITGFQEKPAREEALSKYASTGIYVLEPKVFDYIPKEGTYGFGRQLFPTLVQNGHPVLASVIDDSYWSDVGTISQYRVSNFDALNANVKLDLPGRITENGRLEEGATVAASASIQGKLLLGKNSKIQNGVKCKGSVIIGDNCVIEENAELVDSVIWSGSTVGRGARLVNCVVGRDCSIQGGSDHNEVASVNWPPPLIKK